MIPKDVVIEKLKTNCEVTYNSNMLFHYGQSILKPVPCPTLRVWRNSLSSQPSELNSPRFIAITWMVTRVPFEEELK